MICLDKKMAAKDLDNSDTKKQEELDDITTCIICTEVYTDPKALPCIHTFCMKCIQKTGLKTNKGPGDEMPCPICRRMFTIPSEGFPGLPKHFFIERLIQVSNISDQSTSSISLCDACLEESKDDAVKETPAADTYCIDCSQKYCKECSRQHRKFKLTKNHKLIQINESRGEQNGLTDLASSVCDLHEQKSLDVYCDDSKTVVCAICFIEGHNNHKGSHVSKCVDGFRKQIQINTETISGCICKVRKKKAELLKGKEDMQVKVGNLESEVATRKDELKRLTDEHEASLRQELCSIRQSKLKEILMATDDIDTHLSSLETYNTYCQKVMAEGSASDICGAFSDVSARAVELQQQCQSMIEREIQSFNFRFRKSELREFLEEICDNLIGEIEESQDKERESTMKETGTKLDEFEAKQVVRHKKGNDKLRLKEVEAKLLEANRNLDEERRLWAEEKKQFMKQAQDLQQGASGPLTRYREKPKLANKIDLDHSVWGLAMLNKELFVASVDAGEIFVYDTVSYKRLRRISLEGSTQPRDIAALQQKKCLFVVDLSSGSSLLCIDQKGKILKKWKVPYECHNLSIMSSGNILLTCNARILIYNSDGKLIQDLKLDARALDMSWQTILLRSGNYLVCQGWINSKHHRVLSLSPKGVILKSFGSEKHNSNSHLSDPVYMAVDRDEFIFVADSGNNRVVLLSTSLDFIREMVSEEDGIIRPYRVLLDEDSGLLYVGTNRHQLFVYNVFK